MLPGLFEQSEEGTNKRYFGGLGLLLLFVGSLVTRSRHYTRIIAIMTAYRVVFRDGTRLFLWANGGRTGAAVGVVVTTAAV